MSDLYADAVTLGRAEHYIDIFPTESTIGSVYREWARRVHPDKWGTEDSHGIATECFQILNKLKAEAEEMSAQGRYGERVVLATIKTKRASHQVVRQHGEDTMAVYYRTITTLDAGTNFAGLLKVAKSAKDNDLMAQEARALKKLHEGADEHGNPSKWARAYPELWDTFLHSEGRRRAVVTPLYDGFHSLETVHKRYADHDFNFPGVHVVWIFRRLLMALGYAHDQGLVHGAVTPDNVLIGAQDHAVVLADWCYSQVTDGESKTPIKAVVPMYKDWYPEEVLNKEPPTPATDIYMAAKMMIELFHMDQKADMIKPLRTFFRGTMLTKQSMRPQNAWDLLAEFDELLKNIGEPFYPRRWVDFTVPSGAV